MSTPTPTAVTLSYSAPTASAPALFEFLAGTQPWIPSEITPANPLCINLTCNAANVNILGLLFRFTNPEGIKDPSSYYFPVSSSSTPFSLRAYGQAQTYSGSFSSFVSYAGGNQPTYSSIQIEIQAMSGAPPTSIGFQVVVVDTSQASGGLYFVSHDPQIPTNGYTG